jgi:ABC-type nickel/cobalt efflux system permease component RcnA
VSELSMSSVVTRLRSLSRTTVIAICVALAALVVSLMRLLEASTWAQVVGAVLVFELALTSEADKRRSARLQKAGKEHAALGGPGERAEVAAGGAMAQGCFPRKTVGAG